MPLLGIFCQESGQGREVGRFDIEEFTEHKTIQLHLGKKTSWLVKAYENLP
jgi:betaine-aldehyde dehydrogenase